MKGETTVPKRKSSKAVRHADAPADRSGESVQTAKGRSGAQAQAQAEMNARLSEDRTGKADTEGPGSHPVGGLSSANSASADPFARKKALGEPVPQVTRHI